MKFTVLVLETCKCFLKLIMLHQPHFFSHLLTRNTPSTFVICRTSLAVPAHCKDPGDIIQTVPPRVIPASQHFRRRQDGQFFLLNLSMVQSFRLAQRYFCLPTNIRRNSRWVVGTDQTRSTRRNGLTPSQYHQGHRHHERREERTKERTEERRQRRERRGERTETRGERREKRGPYQCWFPSSTPSRRFMLEVGIFWENSTVLPWLLQEWFITRYHTLYESWLPETQTLVSAVLPSLAPLLCLPSPLPGSTAPLYKHMAEVFRPRCPRRKITLHCEAQQRQSINSS